MIRGSLRVRRSVSIKLLRGEEDPGTNQEAKTKRRRQTQIQLPPPKLEYRINGVYAHAPTALANGPAANMGATRKPGSALNVSPVANMAVSPPSHFEPPTSSTLIPTVDLTPEPLPLMRLQIAAPVTPKPSADDKAKEFY